MKFGKIAGKVLCWLVAIVLILLLILYVGVTVMYRPFYSNSQNAFPVPGLWSGFVPQGFAYLEETDTYLASGYMKDHSACRIYIREQNGAVRYATLQNTDGSAYTAHAGGLAINGDFAYLPGEEGIDVFRLSDILQKGQATMLGCIPMEYEGDCCTFYNGYLFVGDFYRPEVYESPESHHVTTPSGDTNPAMIAVYKADSSAEFGVESHPVAAISIREQVQGIGFTEGGEIVLSTSYGFATSYLWFYQWDDSQKGSLVMDGKEVPLYYLDSDNLTHTVEMPPMSEEVVCKDGKVYVLVESASTKYIFGKLIRGSYVFAYEKP